MRSYPCAAPPGLTPPVAPSAMLKALTLKARVAWVAGMRLREAMRKRGRMVALDMIVDLSFVVEDSGKEVDEKKALAGFSRIDWRHARIT